MVKLILAGVLLMVCLPLSALAGPARTVALPDEGGRITLPPRYDVVAEGDYRWRDTGGVFAYRKYRSMASGTSECDGMIAVARSDAHASLDAFVSASRAALTTRWAFADETEGRWYGQPDTRLPVERRDGPLGPELTGPLSVHIVGFFDVYDKPGRFYAVEHEAGVRIAIWIFDSHGGEARARKMAAAMAKSFSNEGDGGKAW
ncbi:MAG: hypothetical protein C0456_11995 [Hyphomonas sp.]|uniref:hypothetical protein n=1 Tax=Hyphomonas sp. TaxID=87 RepID=UPI001D631A4F|nr:hypothetical protein [Hyphomonas sp.]MBA4227343.1 hypothetical protein [Hyphomonas sp.]